MKNFNYLWVFALLSLATVGCEPLEDINEELEANAPEFNNDGNAVPYTLTEDDYSDLKLDDNYFNDEDEARALIPALLEQQFPILGNGSLVEVTFMVNDTLEPSFYTVVEADYSAAGLETDYFPNFASVQSFLEDEFSQSLEGDLVELSYRVQAEVIEYELVDADYSFAATELEDEYPAQASNLARFGNFNIQNNSSSAWSLDQIVEAIGLIIDENFGNDETKVYNVSYNAYDGSDVNRNVGVRFVDGEYVVESSLATSYTLSESDYDLIGVELASDYPGPAANAARFSSFDIRETSGNYWRPEAILEAFNVVLKDQFPSAVDGSKFNITYAEFPGGATREANISLIKDSGNFVEDNEPTIIVADVTRVFSLTEGEWNRPLELDSSLYQNEFGQRFSNFGDLEDAGYFIGLYLDQLFPYAQPGDYKSVAFRYYNGSRTVTKYGRFEFINGSFKYLPEVIETKLQFGKEDGEWLPDNTIVYVLAASDYDYVADQLGAKYPSETANLSQYGNFNTFSWDDAELLEAFNIILVDIVAPNAEVGQKYQLVVSIYNGSTVNANYALIKTEDGSWKYQD